jgi:hypothetical protein
MTMQNKSQIVRSWKTTIQMLIAAVIALALSVVLFMTIASGPVTIGIALIPAVVGVICIVMAVSGAGQCACPKCSQPMDGLSTGSNEGVLCRSCHQYFEGTAGQLWETDQAKVADKALFSSPVPEQFSFPDQCCVCGQPATHRQAVSLVTKNASSAITESAVGLSTSTRSTVQVPHCDQHKDGAYLSGTQQKTRIVFRSYPYLRAFCQMNNTTPG